MKHELKIDQILLGRLMRGDKFFDVRDDDRDYQVGDLIRYLPIESEEYDVYSEFKAPLPDFKITYIEYIIYRHDEDNDLAIINVKQIN